MKPQTLSTANILTSALIVLAIIMITTMGHTAVANFCKGAAVVASFGAFAAITVLNNSPRRA